MSRFNRFIESMLLGVGLILAMRSASAGIDVIVDMRPPPPKETAPPPPPRPGYVYEPGYWAWDGHQYVWTEGTFVEERKGYRWSEPRWVEEDKRYRFVPGHWESGD